MNTQFYGVRRQLELPQYPTLNYTIWLSDKDTLVSAKNRHLDQWIEQSFWKLTNKDMST